MSGKSKDSQRQGRGGSQQYCVQLYSADASLTKEFYLDAHEYGLPDLAAAERYLRQTLTPTDFARHVSLISGDMLHDKAILQFELAKEEYSVDVVFDAEVPGRVESDEPGENVFIPDKYADDTITQRASRVLAESSLDANESIGIDPYNTGIFETSKSRSRK